jgi:hypothetical protein
MSSQSGIGLRHVFRNPDSEHAGRPRVGGRAIHPPKRLAAGLLRAARPRRAGRLGAVASHVKLGDWADYGEAHSTGESLPVSRNAGANRPGRRAGVATRPALTCPKILGAVRHPLACSSRYLASMQPNPQGPRRLSRSKPMEDLSRSVSGSQESPQPRASWCAMVDLGPPEFRERSRCKFGHGTGAISDANHRRVGPR